MTVRELIIKLLEYEMDAQVQIAKSGELYDIIDIWKGDIVILEAEFEAECKSCCGKCKNAD